jgi:hypothetical protein
MMSDQQIKQQAVIRPSFNIWRAKNGKGEVVTRCLLLLFITTSFSMLIASLGLKNTLSSPLPSQLINCTVNTLDWLAPSHVTGSINTFCSIFIAITAVGVVYYSVVIVIRYLNISIVNNNIKLFVMIVSIFMYYIQ